MCDFVEGYVDFFVMNGVLVNGVDVEKEFVLLMKIVFFLENGNIFGSLVIENFIEVILVI